MIGHNTLASCAEDIIALHREIEGHNKEAAQKAIEAGKKLAGAKRIVEHGKWADWLSAVGIGERTAQRYMQLVRYALNSDTVTDLGGIGAALQWVRPVKLPPKGSVLLASADDFAEDGNDLMGFVWPHGKGYHVAMLDLRPEWPHCRKTKKAIVPTNEVGEVPIWMTLWMSCDWRCADLTFQMVSDRPDIAIVTKMVEEFGGAA